MTDQGVLYTVHCSGCDRPLDRQQQRGGRGVGAGRRGVLDMRGRRDFSRFDLSPGEAKL